MNEKYIDLLHQTTQYSINYIKNIDTMEVFPKSLKELNHLEQKLPQKGFEAKEVIQFLNHIGANTTTAMPGGRYYGFVNGGLLPVAHAAQWLTDTWNQNSALYAMSPFTPKLEEICEMWLVELLCDYAEYFAQKLVKCGFHLVIPVCFNQFLIQCDTDENTKKVLQIVQNSGVCWCGESIWKGKTVIRISICSHATTYEDIDKSVSVFQKAIHQIKQ